MRITEAPPALAVTAMSAAAFAAGSRHASIYAAAAARVTMGDSKMADR